MIPRFRKYRKINDKRKNKNTMLYSQLLNSEEFYICTIEKRVLSLISTLIPIITAILVLTSFGIVSYLVKKRRNKSCLSGERFSHCTLNNGNNLNVAHCDFCKSIYNHTTSFPKEDIELSKNITNSKSIIIILGEIFTGNWDLYPDLDFSEDELKTRINYCTFGGDHCIDKPIESSDCDSDFHLPETDNFEESQDKSIQYTIINNSEIRSERNRNHIPKEVNQRGVPQNKHLKNCERYQGKYCKNRFGTSPSITTLYH